MNHKKTAKRLCRAGIIAALYVGLTYVFMPVAYGPLQVRPAEALTALPMLLPESIPALFIGCALANITSPFGIWDILFGSLTTLLAGFGTRVCKKIPLLAMAFPVLLNAVFLPLIWILMGVEEAFLINFLSILLTQTVFCYGLGLPLYYGLKKHENRLLGE